MVISEIFSKKVVVCLLALFFIIAIAVGVKIDSANVSEDKNSGDFGEIEDKLNEIETCVEQKKFSRASALIEEIKKIKGYDIHPYAGRDVYGTEIEIINKTGAVYKYPQFTGFFKEIPEEGGRFSKAFCLTRNEIEKKCFEYYGCFSEVVKDGEKITVYYRGSESEVLEALKVIKIKLRSKKSRV